MASKLTPTRYGRGAPVPGIDTSASFRKTETTAATSFGGWLTPPQSARDSRRPSLTYSSLSDAPYSATSTDYTFSHPATPVHSFEQQSQEHSGRQYHQLSVSACNTPAQVPSGSYVAGSLQEQLLQSGMQPHGQCTSKSVDPNQSYFMASHHGYTDSMAMDGCDYMPADCWSGAQLASQALHQQQTNGMTATLFDTSQALAMDTHTTTPIYSHPPSEMPGVYSQASSSMYQHPQVVVPSQLTPPDDDYMHDYSPYESPQHGMGAMSSDFSCSFDSQDSYVFARPPSPEDAYFASEDEDGFMAIKEEALWSPTPARPSHMLQSSQLPQRIRKRNTSSTKRIRKPREPCHEMHFGNILITAKGDQFSMSDGKIKCPDRKFMAPKEKKFRCTGVDRATGLRCNRGFDRSEHLKRHAKMHDTVSLPEYPCPIQGCKKTGIFGMSRSDNATDHFITHLETKPGQRNGHCDWATMETSMRSVYAEPQATKMLNNLQKRVSKRKADGKWPVRAPDKPRAAAKATPARKYTCAMRSRL
ncbi:hypothetical protein MBLNU230_g1938t1 [Neophaeotheca triangularis]